MSLRAVIVDRERQEAVDTLEASDAQTRLEVLGLEGLQELSPGQRQALMEALRNPDEEQQVLSQIDQAGSFIA